MLNELKIMRLMDRGAFLQITNLRMCLALISSFIIPMTNFELCAGEYHYSRTWIYCTSRKTLVYVAQASP